jgi:DNA repair photolyase
MFYHQRMPASGVEYREEPCRSALNRVKGMPFTWSLNPYMGCVHRCTFCYVRSFERRADRPSDDRYGRSIRVKTNVAEVLREELARRSWKRESVAIGAATDPYQPAEGRYRLTRACIVELSHASTPLSLITRGPMVVRDVDVLQEAAGRAGASVSFSVPTLDDRVWRATEPGTAPPRQRLRALRILADAGVDCSVALAPLLPGLSDRPARDLGQASLPPARHPRALPGGARARVARGAHALRAALRRPRLPPGARDRGRDGARARSRRRAPDREAPAPAAAPRARAADARRLTAARRRTIAACRTRSPA